MSEENSVSPPERGVVAYGAHVVEELVFDWKNWAIRRSPIEDSAVGWRSGLPLRFKRL
jgi:hypothetical protein